MVLTLRQATMAIRKPVGLAVRIRKGTNRTAVASPET